MEVGNKVFVKPECAVGEIVFARDGRYVVKLPDGASSRWIEVEERNLEAIE